MNRKTVIMTLFIIAFSVSFLILPSSGIGEDIPQVPVKGKVTFLDLGAKYCIPCKMMVPVMQNVEKKYKGKALVVFIDVWEHRDQAKRFGVRAIPTQIFFDKQGKEVYRHIGFMSEAQIDQQFRKMGLE